MRDNKKVITRLWKIRIFAIHNRYSMITLTPLFCFYQADEDCNRVWWGSHTRQSTRNNDDSKYYANKHKLYEIKFLKTNRLIVLFAKL